MSDKQQFDFNLYCRNHGVWLIKYSSPHIKNPVFFIWYKDGDDQDRSKFLTYHDAQIFCTQHIGTLIDHGLTQHTTLSPVNNVNQFVDGLINYNSFSVTYFDITYLLEELDEGRLTGEIQGWITDFIYLVGDYAFNNQNTEQMTILLENAVVTNAIQYYNDCILWPSLNGGNVESTSIPINPVHPMELAAILRKIIALFEEKICIKTS